jgi:hypothetical protein
MNKNLNLLAKPLAMLSFAAALMLVPAASNHANANPLGGGIACAEGGTCCPETGSTCYPGDGTSQANSYWRSDGKACGAPYEE